MAVVDPECRALISEASQTSSAPHADPAEGRQGAACGVGQRKLASASHTGEAPPSVVVSLHFSQPLAQPASEACVNRQLTNSAAKAASPLAITLPLGAPIASTCKA
jgi:hypothetical protein